MALSDDYDDALNRGEVLAEANALAALDEAKRTAIDLKFPLEDQTTYHTHHITFRVFEVIRKSRTTADKLVAKATITLPMTQELQVQYNASYAQPDLGAIGSMVVGGAGSLSNSLQNAFNEAGSGSIGDQAKNILKSVGNKFSDINGQDVGNAAVAGGSGLLSATLSLGGPIAQSALAAVTGTSRNPHKAVLFEGTEFRNHSFQFRFIPVVEEESRVIKQIIKIFKWHMHPGFAGKGVSFGGVDLSAGNHFFKNPEFFEIELSGKGEYTVNDYRTCVLKGITVNYQPSNYPAYVRSGVGSSPAPMEVVMNLEFQEIEIITKDVIGSPYQSAAQRLDSAYGAF